MDVEQYQRLAEKQTDPCLKNYILKVLTLAKTERFNTDRKT